MVPSFIRILENNFPIEIHHDFMMDECVFFDRNTGSFILSVPSVIYSQGDIGPEIIEKLKSIYEPEIDKSKWLHEDWSGNLIEGSLA